MTEKDFIPNSYAVAPKKGTITYTAPSNIALVKYWGKRENQIPANPSLSFTLAACATTTTLGYAPLEGDRHQFSFELYLDGAPKKSFEPKIRSFFGRVEQYLPFVRWFHFKIETGNTFPHSSGIASSASGMAALALCLMEIERKLNPDMTNGYFLAKASFLARLGSGSACRSIQGPLVQWGQHNGIEGSTDLYGIPYPNKVHPVFKTFHDTVLLVDKGQKQVSSTVGHGLMHGHPFAEQRFRQAHEHLHRLQTVLKNGDLDAFMAIVELEALTLHAMMMTSNPYFVLMKPNTLEIIHRIWDFRQKNGCHVCFTLDAGANVHVLYPENEKVPVFRFIQEELVHFCEKGQYICDKVGLGARKL